MADLYAAALPANVPAVLPAVLPALAPDDDDSAIDDNDDAAYRHYVPTHCHHVPAHVHRLQVAVGVRRLRQLVRKVVRRVSDLRSPLVPSLCRGADGARVLSGRLCARKGWNKPRLGSEG